MRRLLRMLVMSALAGTVMLSGCSTSGSTVAGTGSGENTVGWPAAGEPASPTTPSDYAPPPSPAALVTATGAPAQPTALGAVDASGSFCTTARASLKAWGGNPLGTLWSFAQSRGSAAQVKAYLARARGDTEALFAAAPPQIKDSISTLRDAVARLDSDLSGNGYDLTRAGALASAMGQLADPAVAAAWLSVTNFIQAHCSVTVASG
jgi:hypothetical protein